MYKISLIIPIKKSYEYLKDFINSINELDLENIELEILFVLNNIPEIEFQNQINKYEINSNISYRFIVDTGRHSAGGQRNVGVNEAKSEYIVFTDIDCTFKKDWLKKITEPLIQRDYDLTGGGDSLHSDAKVLEKNINYIMTSFLTTGGMRGSCKNKITKFYPRTFNMAVKKSIFNKTGGFINKFYGEDILFSMRVEDLGGNIFQCCDCNVIHRRKKSVFKFLKQQFLMGKARSELYKSQRKMLSCVSFLPTINLLLFISSTLFLLSTQLKIFAYIYFTLLVGYLLLITIDYSIKEKELSLILPVLLLLQQFSYGVGFIVGFVNCIFKRKINE